MNVANWTFVTEICGMKQSDLEFPSLSSPNACTVRSCFLRCLSSYLSSRYRQAEQSSFTVQPRGFEEDGTTQGHWDRSEAAPAGHVSSAASPSQVDERKADVLKSGRLSLF